MARHCNWITCRKVFNTVVHGALLFSMFQLPLDQLVPATAKYQWDARYTSPLLPLTLPAKVYSAPIRRSGDRTYWSRWLAPDRSPKTWSPGLNNDLYMLTAVGATPQCVPSQTIVPAPLAAPASSSKRLANYTGKDLSAHRSFWNAFEQHVLVDPLELDAVTTAMAVLSWRSLQAVLDFLVPASISICVLHCQLMSELVNL